MELKNYEQVKKNYSSNKGELLAVIHFMEKWKFYLWPRKFILRTDHRALRWIYTMDAPGSLAERWLNTLSSYNFEVQFREGKKHANADTLSRATFEEDEVDAGQIQELVTKEIETSEKVSHADSDLWVKAMENDSIMGEIKKWFEHGRPDRKFYRGKDPEILFYFDIFEILELKDNKIVMHWRNELNSNS